MKRIKIKAILLAMLLLVLVPAGVFAQSGEISSANKVELMEIMEKEIEKEINDARQILVKQLEEQDALMMLEVYEEYLYPQIERNVKNTFVEHYGLIIPETMSGGGYIEASNGAAFSYLSDIGYGYKPTEVNVTAMNRSDSYDYFLNKYSFTPEDLIWDILGYVPWEYGTIFGFVSSVRGYVDSLSISRVRDAGGYAEVITTYSREYGTSASITWGWTDRPYIYIPGNSYNILEIYF